MSWGLALHGGAGDLSRSVNRGHYCAALNECLDRGVAVLSGRAAPSFSPYNHLNVATQAVLETVVALENCELFNAGRGSVLNAAGDFEMDAQVMDNRGHSGACTGLTRIRNPVLAAERIMTKSKHALVTSPSAERFAIGEGLATEPFEYFSTEERLAQLQTARRSGTVALDHNTESVSAESTTPPGGSRGDRADLGDGAMGTVGAVAKDAAGNIAFALSTGGMTNKMAGRVGDTPIVGAGGFACDRAGLCATGKGEAFLLHNTCGHICAAMEYGGLSLQDACEAEIGKLAPGDGGVIAVDGTGTVVFHFNSAGMLRAMEESSGRRAVGIWTEWEEKNF